MPSLDLPRGEQLAHDGKSVAFVGHMGQTVWQSGVPTALRLDAPPSNIEQFTILQAEPNQIHLATRSTISGGATNRLFWSVPQWPAGTRIKFKTGAGLLWSRLAVGDNAAGAVTHNLTLGQDGVNATVNFVIPNANTFTHFGFLIGGNQPAGQRLITEFQVILP